MIKCIFCEKYLNTKNNSCINHYNVIEYLIIDSKIELIYSYDDNYDEVFTYYFKTNELIIYVNNSTISYKITPNELIRKFEIIGIFS